MRFESLGVPTSYDLASNQCRYSRVALFVEVEMPKEIGTDAAMSMLRQCADTALDSSLLTTAIKAGPATSVSDAAVRFGTCAAEHVGKEVKVTNTRAELVTDEAWADCPSLFGFGG